MIGEFMVKTHPMMSTTPCGALYTVASQPFLKSSTTFTFSGRVHSSRLSRAYLTPDISPPNSVTASSLGFPRSSLMAASRAERFSCTSNPSWCSCLRR